MKDLTANQPRTSTMKHNPARNAFPTASADNITTNTMSVPTIAQIAIWR